ncbi:MAG: hypothetical protein ACREC5_06755, partial [Thermoplasmata archaeon]
VPTTAIVQVDGVPYTVNAGLFKTGALPGGTHLVTATAPGYSLYHWEASVIPGKTISLTIRLTNQGWINGTITPVVGHVSVNGEYQTVNGGAFNLTEPAGKSYNVTGSLEGYNSFSYPTVAVSPGNGTTVSFALSATSVTPCSVTDTCTCTSNCNPTKNTTGSNSDYLYIAIAIIVILAAAIAIVALSRRRGGGGAATTSTTTTPTSGDGSYDGSSPSEIPKLQSDGSMDSSQGGSGGPPA